MKYDIAIIGGGPAGMMAAGRAGELGAKVILLEKNSKLGIKLLATGGGRCNLTNFKNNRSLAEKFGAKGRWLLSSLSNFGSEEVIEFFNSRGLKTKIEADDRVFQKSDSAQDVLKTLVDYLKTSKVEIKLNAEVKKIVATKNKIEKIILANGQEIMADKFIICSGGKSYPLTGSTGEAYKWLEKLGHKIIEPRPALTPIILQDKFIKKLEGLSLSEVKISLYKNNKKIHSIIGSAIFTANGLSGPAILNMSEIIGRENSKDLKIKIDFFPNLDAVKLDKKLHEDFSPSNKILKNYLNNLVPPKLVDTLLDLAKVDSQKKLNSITKEERKRLVDFLKEFNLNVSGLAGFDRAMLTAGGVNLKEVEAKTMCSKIINNLYLAGEILDLNGPTGGYNLQLCWTTGYMAGENTLK